MEIYYEANDGQTVDFNGDTFWVQNPESIFASDWDYEGYDSAYGGGTVSRIYKGVRDSDDIDLEVVADDIDAYQTACMAAHDIFETDIKNRTPGLLWVNGWYIPCYVYARGYADYYKQLASATLSLTLVYTAQNWCKEVTFSDWLTWSYALSKLSLSSLPDDIADDYGGCNAFYECIVNNLPYSLPVRITFYGAISNPWVLIGENFYQVRADIADGESVVYDTQKRTITLIDSDGAESNLFDTRCKTLDAFNGVENGDSYMYSGGLDSSGDDSDFDINITVIIESGAPDWVGVDEDKVKQKTVAGLASTA